MEEASKLFGAVESSIDLALDGQMNEAFQQFQFPQEELSRKLTQQIHKSVIESVGTVALQTVQDLNLDAEVSQVRGGIERMTNTTLKRDRESTRYCDSNRSSP